MARSYANFYRILARRPNAKSDRSERPRGIKLLPQWLGEPRFALRRRSYNAAATRSPTWVVVWPIFPAARDWILVLMIWILAFSMAAPAWASPRKSSIMAAALIAASGLMTFWPVYFGALPPIGSNMEVPSGLMLPPAATPRPP